MTALFTDQSTSMDTPIQTSEGAVVITVSGEFNGASVAILVQPEGLDPAPAALFRSPGSQVLDLPAGTKWFARLVVRDKYLGVTTAVDLSATPLA